MYRTRNLRPSNFFSQAAAAAVFEHFLSFPLRKRQMCVRECLCVCVSAGSCDCCASKALFLARTFVFYLSFFVKAERIYTWQIRVVRKQKQPATGNKRKEGGREKKRSSDKGTSNKSMTKYSTAHNEKQRKSSLIIKRV